ncbi:hypothetical protein [Xanthomonas arboricola]|uniref:hypothetical protein n=1 Tax=Xanthomonas arboricola TaxID=56448 RepID=UPI0011B03E10|nr:hypothetical protein [Xanthomonas arboricola]
MSENLSLSLTVVGGFNRHVLNGLDGFNSISLVLDQTNGWDGEGINLLADLGARLSGLNIVSTSIVDISFLSEMSGLRSLAISGDVKGRLFLTQPDLTGLALYVNQKKIRFNLAASSLKRFAGNASQESFEMLESLVSLESLTLVASSVSSVNNSKLAKNIKTFQALNMPKLTNVDGVISSPKLEFFRANSCRGLSVNSELASTNICYLAMNECKSISTLELLSEALSLSVVSLVGTTNVADGKVKDFSMRSSLRHMRVSDKKNYDLKDAFLPKDPMHELEMTRIMESLSMVWSEV